MAPADRKKPVELRLAGQAVVIKGGGDEVYLQTVASYVEGKMREISQRTRIVSTQQVALLAAMDIADEYFRSQKEAKSFRADVRERSVRLLDLMETQPAPGAVK